MDAKVGFEITQLGGPTWQAHVDVVAFTTFGDPAKDVVFKSADQALGGALSDVAKSESFEGKPGQSLTLYTHGRIPAKKEDRRRLPIRRLRSEGGRMELEGV